MKSTVAAVTHRPGFENTWVAVAAVPSNVNVFVKALHLLAIAWIATVTGLWIALQPDQSTGLDFLMRAAVPALAIESFAWWFNQWTQTYRGRVGAHGVEWTRALQWNIVPMVFLLLAVAAM